MGKKLIMSKLYHYAYKDQIVLKRAEKVDDVVL